MSDAGTSGQAPTDTPDPWPSASDEPNDGRPHAPEAASDPDGDGWAAEFDEAPKEDSLRGTEPDSGQPARHA